MSLVNRWLTSFGKVTKLYWLVIASSIVMLLPGDIRDMLYLNFDAVLNGEIWRSLSGHITHLSWTHWLFNIAGVLLLQRYYGKYFSEWSQLFAALIFMMLAVSLGLIIFSQSLKWYGGLSGILIGLFYFSALQDYQQKKLFNGIAIAVFTLYIAMQQFSGELTEGLANQVTVATRAHLFGALAGVLWLILTILWEKTRQNH